MSRIGRCELAQMRSAGWEVVEYGPWVRLRAAVRMLAHTRRRQRAEVASLAGKVHVPVTRQTGTVKVWGRS